MKWVCDLRPEALDKVRLRNPSQAVTDSYEEVLADDAVDAVVIATPISTHFALAKAALEAGKHVFVEKPMTGSTADAEELVQLAQRTGLTLMVGHTFVFSPPVRKLKRTHPRRPAGRHPLHHLLSASTSACTRRTSASSGTSPRTTSRSCTTGWTRPPRASTSPAAAAWCATSRTSPSSTCASPRGVIANIDIAWLSPVKLRRTVIVGSKRMALYDDTESVEKVKVYDHGVDYKDPQTFGEFKLSYRTGDIVAPKLAAVEPLFAEASHFIECVTTGEAAHHRRLAGLQVVASLEAAERSLNNHGDAQSDRVRGRAG